MLKMPRFLPLCGLVLALSACGGKQPEGAATDAAAVASATAEATQAAPGPNAKPGLSATGGVLVLPAVPGRPAAVYFALENGSDKAVTLAGVFIDGAEKAEMHETKGGTMAPVDSVAVAPGATVRFERGGKHVMAFEPDRKLAAGGTTEMTLTFSDGDKLSVPLTIEARSATPAAPSGKASVNHAGSQNMDNADHMDHADHMEGMDH